MVRAQYRPPLLFISFDKNSFIITYPYPYPYPYLLSIALILYSGRLLLDYIDLSTYRPIDLSTYRPIDLSTYLSIYLSIYLSTWWFYIEL
ncbi:TPA: hypothetical protein OUF61_001151 [Proteus mirabilis]|nr:hypothetical protein [Proteus mirabilis]